MKAQRANKITHDIESILVLQVGAIGDTIFAIPALKALRSSYPNATIVVLASHRSGEVLRGLPYLDELRICRNGLDLVRTMVEFRQMNFDLAVGLSNQGSWLAFFCGTPYKAGFASPLLSMAEPGSVREEPASHVVEYCLAVIKLLKGTTPERQEPEIWLAQSEWEKADSFLVEHRLGHYPLVAIHPGGRYFPFKRWPVERFAALVDELAYWGAQAVLVGGSEDAELAEAVQEAARVKPVIAASRLRLKETAALIARCQLFIGNDSAPLHLAAAVKTPSVGLFGPTSPVQFGPCGPGHTVIYKELPCSPCYRFLGALWQHCPHCIRPRCMEAITVDEVARAAVMQLKAARPAALKGGG